MHECVCVCVMQVATMKGPIPTLVLADWEWTAATAHVVLPHISAPPFEHVCLRVSHACSTAISAIASLGPHVHKVVVDASFDEIQLNMFIRDYETHMDMFVSLLPDGEIYTHTHMHTHLRVHLHTYGHAHMSSMKAHACS